nr:acyl-CoA dehydrogenase family protein [Ktedonobacterales bacterium]
MHLALVVASSPPPCPFAPLALAASLALCRFPVVGGYTGGTTRRAGRRLRAVAFRGSLPCREERQGGKLVFDFALSPELAALKERTAAFIREEVIPREPLVDEHDGLPTDQLEALRQKARAAGLYAPHLAREWGGLGLNMREMSVIFEEAGRSMLGPLALNCSAPDEGNMHLLERVASPAQKERYLRPLVEGRTRSCFAMTEPPPGAGADPALLRTRAQRRGDSWVLDGDKWYISGADGAAFTICVALTSAPDAPRPRATMFLIDAGTPGYRVVRQIPSLDAGFAGGH